MVIFSLQRPNDVPENFANNSDVGRMLNDTWSPYHIGLTCDGEVILLKLYGLNLVNEVQVNPLNFKF